MDHDIDLRDVQGNILRGYRMAVVRHVVVRVGDAGAARAFLAAAASGDPGRGPQITTADDWGVKPATCLNVGIAAMGLRALGLDDAALWTFPAEYLEGPVVRAEKLGDTGDSQPRNWTDGFANPNDVHLLWSIHAVSAEALDEECQRLEAAWSASGAFTISGRLDGAGLEKDKVHFGYRDSISQPRFRVRQTPNLHPEQGPSELQEIGRVDDQPFAPLGSVLLGYKTPFPSVKWQMPEPALLGINGCFNAFRVIEQDVDAFENFLRKSAAEHAQSEEWIAAKLMGRWRNGVPLALSPDTDEAPEHVTLDQFGGGPAGNEPGDDGMNYFDYVMMPSSSPDDEFGTRCPIGAHIRRTNPRGSRIVQRSANYTRRLVRRGFPYGPAYDPAKPNDGIKRGLLGNFMCASLIAQFESIMYDWVNKGLQDPRITGTNDPIIGANDPRTSRFVIATDEIDGETAPIILRGFPRFTKTVGSAYLFHPSITALKLLAALKP
jgi:deferrochelatase/peroxidase EfeB